MPRGEGITPNRSVRIRREVLDQARIHAVANKKTIGQWLEEAVLEQIREEAINKKGGDAIVKARKGK